MSSDAPLKPGLFAFVLSVLVIGAALAVWTAGIRQSCTFCIVTVSGAVSANMWAGGAAFLALGAITIEGGRRKVGESGASSRAATIVGVLLALGVIAAVVSVWTLAGEPFVADAQAAATVAGTAVGVSFLYVAVIALLFGMRGAFAFGGSASKVKAIPAHEEDQHILLIEGIGKKYATRLNSNGIITVPQLLETDPMTVARAADCQHELAESWQAEGRLMQVKGIGPQFAEILAMAGLRTVQDLASSDVDGLLATIDAIEARRKTRVLKVDVKRHHIEKFVQAARQQSTGPTE